MLDALTAALDDLVSLDAGALADSPTVVALQRELARLEAVASRAAARWDANSEWAADGARSGAAWLAAKVHVPKQQARRCLRLGRAARELPAAESAWLRGDIAGTHVAALAASRSTELLAKAMERDEPALVAVACASTYRSFQRRLDYWRQTNDLDDEEARAARQVDERRLHLSQTFQGTWILDSVLDPISGTILNDTLRVIEHELFDTDWTHAREQLGRDPLLHELARTPAQRRADALVEMAVRARTAPKNGRRPEPLFTVLIGLPRFEQLCELANHTVITPGSLLPSLDRAWVERVVFEAPSRVIDIGARRRLFTGATRRAVEVRDRECFHHTCDEPIEQIDHIQPAAWGGPTTQDNGRGACAFHNRNRHTRRTDEPP